MKVIQCPEIDNIEFLPIVEKYGEPIAKAMFFKFNQNEGEVIIPTLDMVDAIWEGSDILYEAAKENQLFENPSQVYQQIINDNVLDEFPIKEHETLKINDKEIKFIQSPNTFDANIKNAFANPNQDIQNLYENDPLHTGLLVASYVRKEQLNRKIRTARYALFSQAESPINKNETIVFKNSPSSLNGKVNEGDLVRVTEVNSLKEISIGDETFPAMELSITKKQENGRDINTKYTIINPSVGNIPEENIRFWNAVEKMYNKDFQNGTSNLPDLLKTFGLIQDLVLPDGHSLSPNEPFKVAATIDYGYALTPDIAKLNKFDNTLIDMADFYTGELNKPENWKSRNETIRDLLGLANKSSIVLSLPDTVYDETHKPATLENLSEPDNDPNILKKDFDYVLENEMGQKAEEKRIGSYVFGGAHIYESLERGDLNWNDQMPEGLENPFTGKDYTYRELLESTKSSFYNSKKFVLNVNQLMQNDHTWINNLDVNELTRIGVPSKYILSQKINGSAENQKIQCLTILKAYMDNGTHQVAQQLYGKVYQDIGYSLARYIRVTQLAGINIGLTEDEINNMPVVGIDPIRVISRSIADFGIEQAEIQALGKEKGQAEIAFSAEKDDVRSQLAFRMNKLFQLHFQNEPGNILQKINPFSKDWRANEPFKWIYETETLPNGQVKYTGQFIERYEPNTGNNIDSKYFRELNNTIKQFPGSYEAKLAEAKIDFYDFVYQMQRNLSISTGVASFDSSRAFMPFLEPNSDEVYKESGIWGSWLKMFSDDYRNEFNEIVVDYKGVTKTFKEWKEDIKERGKNASVSEKANLQKTFNDIIKATKVLILSGKAGVSPLILGDGAMATFSSRSSLGVSTLAGRPDDDFSIHTSRILLQNFEQLLFKKHFDPVLVKYQAVTDFYKVSQIKGVTKGDVQNVLKFIQLDADRFFFKDSDSLNKSWLGKAGSKLMAFTALHHMGFQPVSALLNVTMGQIGSYKQFASKDGFIKGLSKWGRGQWRLYSPAAIAKNAKFLQKKAFNNYVLADPLALAIGEKFKIVKWVQDDINAEVGVSQRLNDLAMTLYTNGEVAIRLGAFLGEMSKEQYEAFYLDDNGVLQVQKGKEGLVPTIEDVDKWMRYINEEQGKVNEAYKRNSSYYFVGKMALGFRSWLPDFMQNRFRFRWVDAYGNQKEGYYSTTARLAKNEILKGAQFLTTIGVLKKYSFFLDQYATREPITQFEKANLRKIAIDLFVTGGILLLSAGLKGSDDDDKKYEKARSLLAKLMSQLHGGLNPKDLVGTIEKPFAFVYPLKQMANIMTDMGQMKLDKAAKDTGKTIPFSNAVNGIVDLVDGE